MVSPQEQETLQLRALKLQTPIKGTFGLSTLPLRPYPCLSASVRVRPSVPSKLIGVQCSVV